MNWLEFVLYNDSFTLRQGPEETVVALLLAFLCGQVVGWAYLWTHHSLSYSQSFTASLVVLPVLVALMMILMSGSMMIAFGLLAVFAVVRFRNVLKDTRDTTFVLWAIVEGLAVGTGRRSVAIIGLLVVAMIMTYLRVSTFGIRTAHDVVLNLMVGDAEDALAIPTVLHRHSRKLQVAGSRKIGEEGWNYSYRLWLRDPDRTDDLRRELESTAGIRRVDLFVQDASMEV